MHEKNWKKVRQGVTGYGVAMASLSLAHSADASVIDLTLNLTPTLVFGGPASFGGFQAVLGGANDFFQFNDTLGKTLQVSGDLFGVRNATFSNPITTAMAFVTILGPFDATAAGVQTFGFRTDLNQVGWIKINFGGSGGAISYLAAAYNDTPGGNIHAGTFATVDAVPEPSTAVLAGLGLLAMGAVGLKKLRQRREAA